ncbi:MAG: glycosyltransferase [Candidatus Gracilibacteria bacterium]
MTFADHQKQHDQWSQKYPKQQCFSQTLIELIEQYLVLNVHHMQFILEIGGWKGELAHKILPKYPHIGQWRNLDITHAAQTETVENDQRYKVEIIRKWVWDYPAFYDYDLIIMSHVLEHLTNEDAEKLLDKLQNCNNILIEVPIPQSDPPNWENYNGAHILAMSKTDVTNLFRKYGYFLKLKKGDVMFFSKHKTTFVKPLNIMVVGWFLKDKYGTGLAREFEDRGHKVIRISTDWQPKEYLDPKIDYQIFTQGSQGIRDRTEAVKIADMVKKYPEVDCIFLGSHTTMEFDVEHVYNPIYYYFKELAYPKYPYHTDACNIIGMFYAFHEAEGRINCGHHMQYITHKFNVLVPYGVDTEIYHAIPHVPRNYLVGFMGSWDWKVDSKTISDPCMKNVYDNRKRFLMYLKNQSPFKDRFVLKDRDWSFQTMDKWIEFMSHVNIAINCPGNWGGVNERQFFALSMGCILLQWKYPEYKTVGLQDKFNCLLFENEQEIDQQIKWVIDHPNEAEVIRQRGLALAKDHTWSQRADVILETIAAHQEEQKFRLKNFEAMQK